MLGGYILEKSLDRLPFYGQICLDDLVIGHSSGLLLAFLSSLRKNTVSPAGLTSTPNGILRGRRARPPPVLRPIFRIEGAADHLDPEDWIPVACENGIPLAKLFPHGSADTHNPDFTTVNTYLFQSGSKKCSPSSWNPLFTIV